MNRAIFLLSFFAATAAVAQQPASTAQQPASNAQQPAADRPRLHPPAPQNANITTGPEVGRKIPAFDLADQNGKHQTLASLRGPRGLVLAFIRSADW